MAAVGMRKVDLPEARSADNEGILQVRGLNHDVKRGMKVACAAGGMTVASLVSEMWQAYLQLNDSGARDGHTRTLTVQH